jgi:hypothetical protein
MAKLEIRKNESIGTLANRIEQGILRGSISASLEDRVEYTIGDARCIVMVFERYSYAGGNRVSMNVTLFQAGTSPVQICAITSGGSQAVFFKVNTWGEESFLDCLVDVLR